MDLLGIQLIVSQGASVIPRCRKLKKKKIDIPTEPGGLIVPAFGRLGKKITNSKPA